MDHATEIDKVFKEKTTIIIGRAGTGKTHYISNICDDHIKQGENVLGLAFTKTAVKEMNKGLKNKCNALTIHRACSKLIVKHGCTILPDSEKESYILGPLDFYEELSQKTIDKIAGNSSIGRSLLVWDLVRNVSFDVVYYNAPNDTNSKKVNILRPNIGYFRVANELLPAEIYVSNTKHDSRLHINRSVLKARVQSAIDTYYGGNVVARQIRHIGGNKIRQTDEYLDINTIIKNIINYEEWKLKKGFIDYADTLLLAYYQGCEYPNPQIPILVLDESQDINPLQWAICHQWISSKYCKHAYIVGDDAQLIYAFTGANPKSFQRYSALKENVIIMDHIYRFGANIWKNTNRFLPMTGTPWEYSHITTEDHDDYVEDIVSKAALIEHLACLSEKELEGSAIFAATNKQVDELYDTIHAHGIYNIYIDTMHQSKGKTFNRCYTIMDIPQSFILYNSTGLDDLARLMYVSTSRARHEQVNVHNFFRGRIVDADSCGISV
jgi:superfamily I DNA/RNA helicase